MARISNKFRRMCDVYRVFSKDWEHIGDYSDDAMLELYNAESRGTPVRELNGFYIGKRWLNVTVSMWKEDMEKGLLFKKELYADEKFPHWWLDSIFGNRT